MSNKTKVFKTKRRLVQVVYSTLKNLPPKEFPTTEELKTTVSDILPALREHVEGYQSFVDEATEIQRERRNKKLTDEQVQKKVDEINERWNEFDQSKGDEEVAVELPEDAYKIFIDQFERENWGKNWFGDIESFVSFSNALEDVEEKKIKEEK